MKRYMKLGEIRETGDATFPKAWLVRDPEGGYSVILLHWDIETNKARGWFYAYVGDLKGARRFARAWTE